MFAQLRLCDDARQQALKAANTRWNKSGPSDTLKLKHLWKTSESTDSVCGQGDHEHDEPAVKSKDHTRYGNKRAVTRQ